MPAAHPTGAAFSSLIALPAAPHTALKRRPAAPCVSNCCCARRAREALFACPPPTGLSSLPSAHAHSHTHTATSPDTPLITVCVPNEGHYWVIGMRTQARHKRDTTAPCTLYAGVGRGGQPRTRARAGGGRGGVRIVTPPLGACASWRWCRAPTGGLARGSGGAGGALLGLGPRRRRPATWGRP